MESVEVEQLKMLVDSWEINLSDCEVSVAVEISERVRVCLLTWSADKFVVHPEDSSDHGLDMFNDYFLVFFSTQRFPEIVQQNSFLRVRASSCFSDQTDLN